MQGKFTFWVRLLSCLIAGLLLSSFILPMGGKSGEWIPLLGGFADTLPGGEGGVLSGVLGVLFILLIGGSMLVVNSKLLKNLFYPPFTVAFFLLLTLVNPSSVYFSGVHIALLLFVWGQYCYVINQKFTAMFLLSAASMFFAPFVWISPIIMAVSLFGAPDLARTAVKSLGGILLPPLYLMVFRYMAFDDAAVFADKFIEQATLFSPPFYNLNGSTIFLILVLAVVLFYAVTYMFRKMYSVSIFVSRILKMEFLSLILGVFALVLWSGDEALPINMAVALPAALLFSNYFTRNISKKGTKIQLILILCAVAISRLSYFV